MLREAQEQGFKAGLERFGIKEAGAMDWVRGAGSMLFGQPFSIGKEMLQKGVTAPFRGEGALGLKNVFWPSVPKTGPWYHKAGPWAQRGLTTILPAYGVAQAALGKGGDPNESRLSNTLGALGSAAGFAYGFPALGMIGAPSLASLGHHLGTSAGRLVGGHPSRAPDPSTYYPQLPY